MNNYRRINKVIMAVIDLCLIHIGFLLAFYIRFEGQLPQYNISSYLLIIPWLSIAALIIFYLFDFYSNWYRKGYLKFIYSIILAIILFTMLTMAISFWYRGFTFPRSVILLAGLLQFVFIGGIRSIAWHIKRLLNGKRKVIIIGKGETEGIAIAKKFVEHVQGWFVVKGIITIEEKELLNDVLPCTDVIVVSSTLTKEEKAEVISYSFRYGKEVMVVPELYELFIFDAEIQQIDDMPVLSVVSPKLTTVERVLKRIFDIVISSLILIGISPLMLLFIFLIPLTSRGPAIFSQERLGRDEKPYMLYKFRSMVKDAEKITGPVLASEDDPRITKLGRLLRATRMDELPQLFNVINGDMSLVGPRPERGFFAEQFKEKIPEYGYRMTVKPGITGLAQVAAKYSTNVEDKLRYDLMYLRNYSLVLDIKILFQTILVVLQKEKSLGIKFEDQNNQQLVRQMLISTQIETAAGKKIK
jgi:exopolysaccharide biosynthesis polyprenyl glycosylphosphotransferase